MRPEKPRLSPLAPEDWSAEQREILAPMTEGGSVFNIFATLVRHPKLLKRWLPFANHVLFKSSLPPREREMAILRIGYLCRADYEWGQHVEIGKRVGLSAAEIERIASGPDAPGWTPFEAALLRAVDELHGDACIAEPTWRVLAGRYDEAQLLDLVFTVGNYALVSMALNTMGVPLDPGIAGIGAKP